MGSQPHNARQPHAQWAGPFPKIDTHFSINANARSAHPFEYRQPFTVFAGGAGMLLQKAGHGDLPSALLTAKAPHQAPAYVEHL